MISLLFQRSLKDVLSSLGPSLVGSSLLITVFTLNVPTLDTLVLITIIAFIFGLILNSVNSIILDTWVLSPKRISNKSVTRIQSNIKAQLLNNNFNNQTFNAIEMHLKKIFNEKTKKDLQTYKFNQTRMASEKNVEKDFSVIQGNVWNMWFDLSNSIRTEAGGLVKILTEKK